MPTQPEWPCPASSSEASSLVLACSSQCSQGRKGTSPAGHRCGLQPEGENGRLSEGKRSGIFGASPGPGTRCGESGGSAVEASLQSDRKSLNARHEKGSIKGSAVLGGRRSLVRFLLGIGSPAAVAEEGSSCSIFKQHGVRTAAIAGRQEARA
mmetsp:Transcript_111028/g.220867  ORF Transcript_111028/g.220867 Transcript_111028/m.220867 type:complete len:153 (+) Transcript_111028:185-643(+)